MNLNIITDGCLKCKNFKTKESLFLPQALCKKKMTHPHILNPKEYVGHCEYLDYDQESCLKFSVNLEFVRRHCPDRLIRH